MLDHRITTLERRCTGRSEVLDKGIVELRLHQAEFASRIGALIAKNRLRAEKEIGDAVEDLYNSVKSVQDDIVAKYQSTYYKGGPVSAASCATAIADDSKFVAEFGELVSGMEEVSAR